MKKAADWIAGFQMNLAIAGMIITTVAVLLQIASRYTGISMRWTEDLTKYPFAWAIFLGASTMYYRKAHFKLDILEGWLSRKPRAFLQIFIYAVLLIFTCGMIYYGAEMTVKFWNYNWMTIPQFKLGYTYFVVPFCGATMTFFSIYHIYDACITLKSCDTGGGQK